MTFIQKLTMHTALVAPLMLVPVFAAADIDITTSETATQVPAANGDTVSIIGAGDLDVTDGDGINTNGLTGISVVVDTTGNGISASGGTSRAAINARNATATINSITITDGLVTSENDFNAGGTIDISGASQTTTIDIGAQGSVTNTAASAAAAINFDDNSAGGPVTYNATITNAGIVSVGDVTGAQAITMEHNNGVTASNLTVNNTGTISATAATQRAINHAGGSGDLLVNNSGAGAITGIVRSMGALSTATINNSDTATITGLIETFAGNLNVNVTGGGITGNLFTNSGATNIDINGGTVTGDVNLGNNVVGALDVASGTLTGDVLMGNSAQVFTYSGGSFDGSVSGAGQFHIDADFTSDGLGQLISLTEVEVANGAVLTLGGNVAATNINIDNGILRFGANNRFLQGNVSSGAVADSTLEIGSGQHTILGTLDTTAGDTVRVAVDGTAAGGLQVFGTATIANNTLLAIDLTSASAITGPLSYTIIDGANGSSVAQIDNADINVNGSGTNKSARLTFTTVGGEDLTLNVSRATLNSFISGRNSSVATTLDGIGMSGGAELDALNAALDAAATIQEIEDILTSVSPEVDNTLTRGMFNATEQSVGVLGDRIAGFRQGAVGLGGSGQTGLSSGDPVDLSYGAWAQVFGGSADQDDVDGTSGYGADTYGLAAGFDRSIDASWAWGVSGSYAETGFNSNSGLKSTDVESYQAAVYAAYESGDFFMDGVFGTAYNQFETSRTISAASVAADGDFDGQTYFLRLSGGQLFSLENGVDLTPKLSVMYIKNRTDSYTETGAGALNLNVDNDNSEKLEARLGLSIAKTFKNGGADIRPEFRIAAAYDLIGAEQRAVSSFSGVGTTFVNAAPDVEELSFEIGASVNILVSDNYTVSANYDFEARSGYQSQTGSIMVNFAF